jgi:hypothetical protein
MGDATHYGAIQRQIEQRILNLQKTRDKNEYRKQLLEFRELYRNQGFLKYLLPIIEQKLKILAPEPGDSQVTNPQPIV